jgi:monoamine oxidase
LKAQAIAGTIARPMARSPLLRYLQRVAHSSAAEELPSSRRKFLRRTSALAIAGAVPAWSALAAGSERSRVIIVGAGLAGLTAARELGKAGVRATLYEGSSRLGGRCWTDRTSFADAQIAERGGELVDTTHEAIRTLAQEMGLALDDLTEAEPRDSEALAYFDGAPYTSAEVNGDFAKVRPALEKDAKLMGEDLPTYAKHTMPQRVLDRMSAAEWIDARVPGGRRSRFGQLLVNAYGEELGGDPGEISAISVVALLAGSPADRFSPYEESDQRYHIRGGNDQLVSGMAAKLEGAIETRSRLVALARRSDGRYRLVFLRDGDEREEIADRVILTLPFSTLRLVDLRQAGFGARKMQSINELGMGRNTKLQLQFTDRFWQRAHGNGEYRLRGAFQTTWDVTRAQPGAAGILNFFSGGSEAVAAGLPDIDTAARTAMGDLARYSPGLEPLWNARVIRNAWDRNPWSLGSYALIKPGQYTSFYGVEGEPAGHVYFAGEHTSIESQGYMNGAVETGQRAAGEVLASLGARKIKAAIGTPFRAAGPPVPA